MRPNAQTSRSPRSDLPRRILRAGLVEFSRRIWQAGNAAISRLLGRQRSGGQPRAAQTLAEREQACNDDCSDVRVHQGAATQAAAAALSATDSTHGDDLSLSAEPSAPESLAGRALIAHELAHAVQHHAAELEDDRSQPGDRCEQTADRAAQQAVQESSAQSASGGAPPAVQRQPQAEDRVAREEVRMVLEGFLRRAMHAQGGRAWWVTPEGRNAVIGLFVGDAGHLLAITAWLNSPVLPDDPVELAGEVARRLPETITTRGSNASSQWPGGRTRLLR